MKKHLTFFILLIILLSSFGFSQGQWKHGGNFGFDKPSEDLAFYSDKRGVIHAVARNGTELRHYMRGSKNPYPWETEGRIIPGEYIGSGSIRIWKDGNLQVIWPMTNGENSAWWEDPRKFKDPSKKPTPPFPAKYETYSINWIGLLPWMVMEEMAGNDVSDAVEILVEKSRRSGAAYIHSFCWVGDPSQPYHQYATPWKWKDGKIDFSKKNPEHKRQFKALAKMCKKYDMEFRPIFFMNRYNNPVFEGLNHQGIYDFYSPEAVAIQKQYIFDCIHWLKDIFDKDYQPTVLLINEPAHYGNDEEGHNIAEWHKEIGDCVLRWTTPERLWVDSSHSEYAHSYFVGSHQCPKCDHWFGREEYFDRPVRSENHGCSTLQGFIDNGFEELIGSAWTHGTFNEDGSAYGSKLADGIPDFRFANYEELGESLRFTMPLALSNGVIFNFVAFPPDGIKQGKEYYWEPLLFDWARLGLFPIIYKEIR